MKMQRLLSTALLACMAGTSLAQFDPSKVAKIPDAVAKRYQDPQVSYGSPSLSRERADFASHDEAMAFVRGMAQAHEPRVKLDIVGQSQQGRDIPLVLLSASGSFQQGKPTVLILGQQHGNEPAGGEAALALIEQLATVQRGLLRDVNVLIMPRANPDGAQNFVRATASGLDVNRDHLLLQTPEATAIAKTALKYSPNIVLDLHEFTVGGRWIDKFAAYAKYDAMLQAATVGNMNSGLTDLALQKFVAAARSAIESQGQTTFWYHTSSADAKDQVVSMGGVQPDTGRNVYGLRNTISMLIETRGIGLGRAHFKRRVHSHVVATLAVLRTAGEQAPALQAAVQAAGAATAASACKGDLVIRAQASEAKETLQFVDAATGADRAIEVPWRSALTLKVQSSRPRPCGYWLSAIQTEAVGKLITLGLQVRRISVDQKLPVERYRVLAEKGGQRQDARGAIAATQAIRELTLATEKFEQQLPAGSWYVPLDQALGAIAAAALEPDSQSSYGANHVMDIDERSMLRVLQPLAR
jgi:hypothetical protein